MKTPSRLEFAFFLLSNLLVFTINQEYEKFHSIPLIRNPQKPNISFDLNNQKTFGNEIFKKRSKILATTYMANSQRFANDYRIKRSLANFLANTSNYTDHHISKYNLSETALLDEIIEDLSKSNLKNSMFFLKSLANSFVESNHTNLKLNSDDINECEVRDYLNDGPCDSNAVCLNTPGSFKCQCNKGFIGSGKVGECFRGGFCSGRFCRLNGECLYANGLNDYKCTCTLDCLNGGRCVMSIYKYECQCPKNVTGILCEDSNQMLLIDEIHPQKLF